jgi:hypothetical protein
MNKKIPSEIAIGVIVFVAVIIGYSFWKSNNIAVAPTTNTSATTTTTIPSAISDSGACQDWFKILPDGSEVKMSDPNCKEKTDIPEQVSPNLVIKEWGVQFEKPANMDDLQYEISKNDRDTVFFITQKLINLDKSTGGKYCTVSQGPIGALSRVQNFDSYKQDGRYIPTSIQIGNYFYFFTGPQATCSDNKQVQTLESEQISSLTNAISNSLQKISSK